MRDTVLLVNKFSSEPTITQLAVTHEESLTFKPTLCLSPHTFVCQALDSQNGALYWPPGYSRRPLLLSTISPNGVEFDPELAIDKFISTWSNLSAIAESIGLIEQKEVYLQPAAWDEWWSENDKSFTLAYVTLALLAEREFILKSTEVYAVRHDDVVLWSGRTISPKGSSYGVRLDRIKKSDGKFHVQNDQIGIYCSRPIWDSK